MADYYTIKKQDGRWWFIPPDGTPFWSIGINHIDSAAFRFAESDGVWEREFGNNRQRWLRDRHLRDANVCGINFCATLYDRRRRPADGRPVQLRRQPHSWPSGSRARSQRGNL